MIVVNDLDEWLDFRALGLSGFRHAAGDLGWVAFDTGDEGVWERVGFGTGVERLDYDDLSADGEPGEPKELPVWMDLPFSRRISLG